MCMCHHCGREFEGSQNVKAHLRTCPDYLKSKGDAARATSPNTPSQGPALATTHGPPVLNPLSEAMAQFATQISAQFAGPDEATRLRQKRESSLTLLLANLVDWYRPPEGVVTPAMAAAAKVAMLDELRTYPIGELSHAELTLRGEVIRNRVFAPFLKEQQTELRKQQEVKQLEKLRVEQHTDTQARRITRKTALIELGLSRALQSASSRGFPPRVCVVLEWETRTRLEVLVVGDETESQVDETIEAAISRPLLEWETRVEQYQNAERQRVLDKCLKVALPVVEAAAPWVQDVVVKYIRDMLGMPPGHPSSAHEASTSSMNEAPPDRPESPTPHHVRRPRVRPSPPPTDGKEGTAPEELAPLTSTESRTGTS